MSLLKDAQADSDRAKSPEWYVSMCIRSDYNWMIDVKETTS